MGRKWVKMENNFSEVLRHLVDSTGMSLYEISRASGISQSALQSYHSRRCKPDLENLVKLADYFAVPLDYLAGRCTLEQAKEISENYSSTFMVLRRAPYEAYLIGRKPIKVHIGEGEEPWPYNLMGHVCCVPWNDVISDDQIAGINTALDELEEREKESVLRYLRDGITLAQSGAVHGVTLERERQILAKALRKLRAPHRKALMVYGKEGCEKRSSLAKFRKELAEEEAEVAKLKSRIEAKKANIIDILRYSDMAPDEKKFRELPIEEMDLSVRSYNCLHRSGYKTLGGVIDLVESGKLINVRNLGRRSAEEILDKIYIFTHKSYTPEGLLVEEMGGSNGLNV